MNSLAVLDPLAAQVATFSAPLTSVVIRDDDTQVRAKLMYDHGRALKDKVVAARMDYTRPLDQQKKAAMDLEKKILDPLEKGLAHLVSQLKSREIQLQREREAQLKAAEDERKKKEEEAKIQAAREVSPPAPADEWAGFFAEETTEPEKQLQAAHTAAKHERVMTEIAHEHMAKTEAIQSQKVAGARKIWKYEVTDKTLVPREYLEVDDFAVRKAVREGKREIPGIRIFEDVSISARGI